MKAFLWCLYLPDYPDLGVEIHIGDRYRPDVVGVDAWREPRFWGEAGQVGVAKIRSLVKRYRSTHFAIAKWQTNLEPLISLVSKALDGLDRKAPFDLISFSADSAERFINERGYIQLTHDDVEWVRLY